MDRVASGAIRGETRPCRGFRCHHQQEAVVDPRADQPERQQEV